MYRKLAILGFALGIVPLSAGSATGQSLLTPSTPSNGVWIDVAHTNFKSFETSLPSTVWYIAGRVPVMNRLSAVVDVPFSYAKVTMDGEPSESNSVFGNPYVGVELAATNALRLELGTRLPLNTADGESFADVIAFIADPLRPEAFLDDLVPLSAAATYQRAVAPGFAVRARGGVTSLFFTGDDVDGTEAAVDYGLAGTYMAGIAQFSLGFNGRWFSISDEGTFSENSLHQASLSADVGLGPVRPGVSLRMPLDSDFRDVVNSSVGFYLQVPLR